ncbi:hypothetical protein D3C87_1838820 [compost metagenome]
MGDGPHQHIDALHAQFRPPLHQRHGNLPVAAAQVEDPAGTRRYRRGQGVGEGLDAAPEDQRAVNSVEHLLARMQPAHAGTVSRRREKAKAQPLSTR